MIGDDMLSKRFHSSNKPQKEKKEVRKDLNSQIEEFLKKGKIIKLNNSLKENPYA